MPPFSFNGAATPEIYTLSLHDALPISTASRSRPSPTVTSRRCGVQRRSFTRGWRRSSARSSATAPVPLTTGGRSEEHTSELQSHVNLVCRLLLEKKKKNSITTLHSTP